MNFDLEKAIETVWNKVEGWVESFIAMIPNMAVAILLLLLFFLIAKISQKAFSNIFRRASNNRVLGNLFSTIVYYAVMGIGLFVILGVLKLEKTVTSLLAGVGVLGLALGFAFQDVAANFISGIILAFRTPFVIGDIVEVKDQMGIVQRTNLRVTVIKTFQGQEVYIPNKDVLQSAIVNYSILGERRVDISIGVSYGDDLEKVEKVVRKVIGDMEGVIRKDEMIFDYYEFANSSINFNIRFWIKYPDQPGFLQNRHEAIKKIKAAFAENDITIPFPIRTLDFGIKGGQTLSEMSLNLPQGDKKKQIETSKKEADSIDNDTESNNENSNED
ncbi:mechanosensitive ion channel family protein [Fulvivirga sp. RKSG066]|uniref:mechanosensitive ion channel family protein n=1 Tax=Fulvivirga aurantia TaxID=2529383 RepID=UPI0012BB525E|nr:mechanosensitive ion channel family protein [Fulvivirga aurantia]MTI20016.1 mechanosensitive ion channel family protein [Fulvivirga aurantia]